MGQGIMTVSNMVWAQGQVESFSALVASLRDDRAGMARRRVYISFRPSGPRYQQTFSACTAGVWVQAYLGVRDG